MVNYIVTTGLPYSVEIPGVHAIQVEDVENGSTMKTTGGNIKKYVSSGSNTIITLECRPSSMLKYRMLYNYLKASAWDKHVVYLDFLNGTIECYVKIEPSIDVENAGLPIMTVTLEEV